MKITSLVLSVTAVAITAFGIAALELAKQESAASQVTLFIRLGAFICLFAILVSITAAGWITRPLDVIHHILRMVSTGELPEKSPKNFTGEFGKVQSQIDELVELLKRNTGFAQKLGDGKLDTPFHPAGSHDSLGIALVNMRDNLLKNDRKEKDHNWIVLGLAEAGNILRTHDTLANLGDAIIRFTVSKVGAIQGAFYVLKDSQIQLRNSFAYNRKKHLKAVFQVGEGLVGQAVAERDVVMRTEIPDDYVTLTSGILGDKKPSCILIVPLIADEQVHGVIELAGLQKFESLQISFVKELSLMLARTIFNITVNERTKALLTEAQELSADLKEKQEVLRQNAEEMQASQEELTRANLKLEEQIEEVNRTRNRMQLLLENASEVITICEGDGTIRYVSPSVKSILGYSPESIQGSMDLNHVHPDGQETYRNLFQQMKLHPSVSATAQFQYKTRDGHYIWLETTGRNFIANPAIHGYILNSRDITERRRAEQEQRMRSKMQALSENSPDLIARLENGVISYINPIIETYTGLGASNFLQQNVQDVPLEKTILNNWIEITENVRGTGRTASAEMEFPSRLGDRIMQVNAIPEFDESHTLESVLVVSHDVTERKRIEIDIQNKNKKINDSINYARRIQNAILPDSNAITNALPDSFILYKPRDVVSGDFPWFVQLGSDVFIAAVDCTGHGGPGALLSLIGYFLLNDIVRSRKVFQPGKILDLLDEGVTQTLRQDLGISASKDGMDIALCRINTEQCTVEYAGAHRPLFIVSDGQLSEIKGDKFPIGGGIYKNQTSFTNTKVRLRNGDGIYFSSDGFPDQFGGPEQRKFGSRRMRELVAEVHATPAREAAIAFDRAWESWRNDQKQTDDMLLIGIRL